MCANAAFRCDIYTNWMIKNFYFYCMASATSNTTYTANPQQEVDPSIAEFPQTEEAAATVPAVPAAITDVLFENKVEIADAAALEKSRSNDWAFHFFKQKTSNPKILDPKKCELSDNISHFGFVRGWWFDRRNSLSQNGTAPLFLRVIGDDICMCPQCREGFQLPD
mmetsp:Transcript_43100/g.36176  ORF Transcript_43100/g.36176 Transcript_43100/m.36176 type:complete len:166 (+) Transcript_43100:168-665(+)